MRFDVKENYFRRLIINPCIVEVNFWLVFGFSWEKRTIEHFFSKSARAFERKQEQRLFSSFEKSSCMFNLPEKNCSCSPRPIFFCSLQEEIMQICVRLVSFSPSGWDFVNLFNRSVIACWFCLWKIGFWHEWWLSKKKEEFLFMPVSCLCLWKKRRGKHRSVFFHWCDCKSVRSNRGFNPSLTYCFMKHIWETSLWICFRLPARENEFSFSVVAVWVFYDSFGFCYNSWICLKDCEFVAGCVSFCLRNKIEKEKKTTKGREKKLFFLSRQWLHPGQKPHQVGPVRSQEVPAVVSRGLVVSGSCCHGVPQGVRKVEPFGSPWPPQAVRWLAKGWLPSALP